MHIHPSVKYVKSVMFVVHIYVLSMLFWGVCYGGQSVMNCTMQLSVTVCMFCFVLFCFVLLLFYDKPGYSCDISAQ